MYLYQSQSYSNILFRLPKAVGLWPYSTSQSTFLPLAARLFTTEFFSVSDFAAWWPGLISSLL